MCSTHAAEIKFHTHVLQTLSFKIVKKNVAFKFASMKNSKRVRYYVHKC